MCIVTNATKTAPGTWSNTTEMIDSGSGPILTCNHRILVWEICVYRNENQTISFSIPHQSCYQRSTTTNQDHDPLI